MVATVPVKASAGLDLTVPTQNIHWCAVFFCGSSMHKAGVRTHITASILGIICCGKLSGEGRNLLPEFCQLLQAKT